jgi:leucine-rich repeat protein SHOC2
MIESYFAHRTDSFGFNVCKYVNIRLQLALDDNQLVSLGNLALPKSLVKLTISGNQLKSVPECIRGLSNLKELNLSGNRIDSVPSWLNTLTALESLDLSRNAIPSLVPEIGILF